MSAFISYTLTRAFWKHLRDGAKQLHLVDVEIGRILLRREGYTGSVEELRHVSGKFDATVRASFGTSGATCAVSLPTPLSRATGMLNLTGAEGG